MAINPNSHVPVFRQIAHHLRASISAGVYRPGDALPSQRVLAVEMVVNPNTVQRAYEALEREGLVTARRGLGLFVSERAADIARANSLAVVGELLSDAVRSGLSAGLTAQEVQESFRLALDQSVASQGRTT